MIRLGQVLHMSSSKTSMDCWSNITTGWMLFPLPNQGSFMKDVRTEGERGMAQCRKVDEGINFYCIFEDILYGWPASNGCRIYFVVPIVFLLWNSQILKALSMIVIRTWLSQYQNWTVLDLRVMQMVVTAGALRCANLQSISSPPTNQHPALLQAGCPSCHPTNSVKALKGNITFHGSAHPKLICVF